MITLSVCGFGCWEDISTLYLNSFYSLPEADGPVISAHHSCSFFVSEICLIWNNKFLKHKWHNKLLPQETVNNINTSNATFYLLFVDFQQTNVEAAIKWALTTRWGLPMPTGWTPTTRQSPTSWQALPTQLWPDATWVCQGRVGKTW